MNMTQSTSAASADNTLTPAPAEREGGAVPSAKDETKLWYALRVTYQRELKAKQALEQQGYECFVPLTQKMVMRGGKRRRVTAAAVANLLFLHITPADMRQLKATTSLPLRYIMDGGTKKPVVVPDAQMRLFIEVASHDDQDVVYVDPALPTLLKGAKVRVTGGMFAGVEGVFVRLRGDRRVVVSIPGVSAVATAFIHPSLVEPINAGQT